MSRELHFERRGLHCHLLWLDCTSFRATSPQVSFFRSNTIFYRLEPSKHATSCRDDEMIMKHHESDIWQMDCIHLYHCTVPVLLSFDKTWNTSSARIFRDKCFGFSARREGLTVLHSIKLSLLNVSFVFGLFSRALTWRPLLAFRWILFNRVTAGWYEFQKCVMIKNQHLVITHLLFCVSTLWFCCLSKKWKQQTRSALCDVIEGTKTFAGEIISSLHKVTSHKSTQQPSLCMSWRVVQSTVWLQTLCKHCRKRFLFVSSVIRKPAHGREVQIAIAINSGFCNSKSDLQNSD